MVAKNKNGKKPEVCLIKTRRQKFWGVVALGLLFICGVMVGLGFNVRQDSVSIKHGLINPSVSVVELLNGVVGLSVSQTVDVAVEDGVKISDVKVSEDVAGMKNQFPRLYVAEIGQFYGFNNHFFVTKQLFLFFYFLRIGMMI